MDLDRSNQRDSGSPASPCWAAVIGDAIIKLRDIESASVDAVISDPPYCSGSVSEAARSAAKGQGLRSENIARFGWFVGDNMGTAGLSHLLRETAIECLRILKPTGSLLFFCDWRQAPNVIPAVESCGFRYQNLIVWDKTHMGLGNGFRARHELIMHMTTGSPEYYDRGAANVLAAKRVHASDRQHQTQKPVDLMRQLVRVVSPIGGMIVDPFMGSGSTGVAAIEEGRRFFGIERDPNHYQTAIERMKRAGTLQIQTDEQEQRILFTEQSGLPPNAQDHRAGEDKPC